MNGRRDELYGQRRPQSHVEGWPAVLFVMAPCIAIDLGRRSAVGGRRSRSGLGATWLDVTLTRLCLLTTGRDANQWRRRSRVTTPLRA